MELLRVQGVAVHEDSKTYRQYSFAVPPGLQELCVAYDWDPAQDSPHSQINLSLYDPNGARGAAHRYATHQVISVGPETTTPGFSPGPLPAGEWTVELDLFYVVARPDGRPSEYRVAVEGIPGKAGSPAPTPLVRRRGRGTPPGSPRRWYKGELHLHTQHSDAEWTPAELGERCRQRGLDFIALTDHNTVTGLPEIMAHDGPDFLVIPGMELTTFNGHALALGVDHWLDWRTGLNGRTINDVARDVRAAGGLFVVSHPDAPPDEVCTGCRWQYTDLDPALAHAVEAWGGSWHGRETRNFGCISQWRTWLNQGYRLTAVGATDAHSPRHWQGHTPLTYVHAEELSEPAVLQAIREGRTYVSSGPYLAITALGRDGQRATMGEGLAAEPPPVLQVSWGESPGGLLHVVGNGVLRHTKPISGSGRCQVTAFPGDHWYCAELWSESGSTLLALTSAVYLAP